MAEIVNGRVIADKILDKLKAALSREKTKPHLAVVLVGSDPASLSYVKRKQRAAEYVGMRFSMHKYPATVPTPTLIKELKNIQAKNLQGIIVQLPLPKKLDKQKILNALDPELDVDYLSWESLGKLVIGENPLVPPTPGAILEILKFYSLPVKSKHVVVVGAGDLIGKPLTNLFLHMPVTLTVCRKETKNLGQFTKQADILITGAGKAKLIRRHMVKPGAVVIDAGVSFANGRISGDTDFSQVAKVAKLITPTPGGVGPITVAKLLENVYLSSKLQRRT